MFHHSITGGRPRPLLDWVSREKSHLRLSEKKEARRTEALLQVPATYTTFHSGECLLPRVAPALYRCRRKCLTHNCACRQLSTLAAPSRQKRPHSLPVEAAGQINVQGLRV